jgi:dephospho-CoA kinase
MTVVGLTGGVAAGKSTVSVLWASLGAIIFDADVFAREAVALGTPGLAAIAQEFGPTVLLDSGELDRKALGERIFADPAARAALNGIVHPYVRALSAAALDRAGNDHPRTVLVYDVPLLAESRDPGEFDLVVVVDAPAATRVSRLQEFRGLTREQAENRVSSQASDADRLALADVVLDASGSLEDTTIAARELYEALTVAWPDKLQTVPTRFPSSAS